MAARAVQGAFGAVLARAEEVEQGGACPDHAAGVAATWLDAAGVPPRIASVLMDHATPALQADAALGARPFDDRPTRTRPAPDLLSLTHTSPDPGDAPSPGEY